MQKKGFWHFWPKNPPNQTKGKHPLGISSLYVPRKALYLQHNWGREQLRATAPSVHQLSFPVGLRGIFPGLTATNSWEKKRSCRKLRLWDAFKVVLFRRRESWLQWQPQTKYWPLSLGACCCLPASQLQAFPQEQISTTETHSCILWSASCVRWLLRCVG